MSQNIYDTPDFFAGYSRLPRSIHGLAGAPEWPSLQALLPALAGRRVVDLGCGFGWFCRWAREQGAAEVLGLDLSQNMLARARASTNDAAIVYECCDLEQLDLPEARFDLAYSSLALHYIVGLERLLAVVRRALVPGGRLVFSAEHPLLTAPRRPAWIEAGGRRVWPVEGYLNEGPRTTDWLAPGVVKQHRTVGTYVNLLLRQGFALDHLEEWGPSEAQATADPGMAIERERPFFLLVAARAV